MSDATGKPKPEFTEDEARKFWQEARAKVARGECDFRHVHFPPDPAGDGFTSVTFSGPADFSGARFDSYTTFLGARFDARANFWGTCFGGYACFLGAHFAENALFLEAQFGGDADFQAARFAQSANFSRVQFSRDAFFTAAEFCRGATFLGALFNGRAVFWNVVSKGVFEIGLVERPIGTPTRFRSLGEGEGAYRLAKQSAADRGDYRLAGQYHYAEQSAICWRSLNWGWVDLSGPRQQKEAFRQRVRRAGGGVWRVAGALLELAFGRFLFGYGERVRGILVAAAGVILGFAGYYAHQGIVETAASTPMQPAVTHNLGTCLYFSIVTFTTLGYGDMRPIPELRFWAGLEALIGAFLMALFVVAMSRKFTR